MKKLLSVIMVVALVLSLGSMLSVTTSAIPNTIVLPTIADGNSFANAKSMSVNTSYSDNITEEDDVDYYKFTLADAGSVYINFKHENLFDLDEYWTATLYNSNTEEVSCFSFLGTDTNIDTYKVGLDKGTYYLMIRGGNWGYKGLSSEQCSHCWDNATYTFNLKYTKSEYWEKENNEEFKTATSIYGNKSYSGSINDEVDVDYYKFTFNSASSLYFNFKHKNLLDSEEYWTVTLFNSNTEEITYFSFFGTDTNINTCRIGLDKGTYYLMIRGGNWGYKGLSSDQCSHCWDNATYTFNLKYNKSAYWEKENNEEFKTASTLYLNNNYSGSINDREDIDYYKFTLSQKSYIKLNFNIKKQNSQDEYYCVNLFDSKNNEILSQPIYGNKATSYVVTILSPGTYYIEIYGGNWYPWDGGYSREFVTDTYTFKVEEILPATSKVTATQTINSITLKWNKVSGATGYIVYKYNPGTKKYVRIATTKANNYKCTKLSAGTNYKFLVKAYKTKNGTTIYSTNKAISTCTKPNTVKVSKVTTSKKSATIIWNKLSASTGYHILYSTNKSFKSARSAYVNTNSKKYITIRALTSGKTYYFKVRAYKKVAGKTVYGAYSSVKSKKIK